MRERRNIKRWSLLLFLPVYNQDTGEVLGHIADITADGFMVFSKKSIMLNSLFSLKIQADDLRESLLLSPNDEDEEADIYFTAESRWTDVNPGLYRTGLMFKDLTEENNSTLRRIVRKVAQNLY
jgi:hypothetical protein